VSLDPIVLRGVLHETIWGGDHLATLLGKSIPPGVKIGEAWETSLDAVATNPPYVGRTLGDLASEFGARLYGTRARAVMGDRFPLLVKFLDAHAWLSVQVHPDDAYAAAHEGGKLGKTEAWRILHTENRAHIIHGFARATDRAAVERAIHDDTLLDLTARVPVHPGDVILNPAGTIHATGAGIVLYEIQEYSDVTYRLHDFGRIGSDGQPRQLHIAQALDVLDYDPPPRHTQRAVPLGPRDHVGMDERHTRLLVACTHFALLEADLTGGYPLRLATDGASCRIVSLIAGAVELSWGSLAAPTGIALGAGETVILPADPGTFHFTPDGEDGDIAPRLLVAWVPTPDDPAVLAWQAAQE
jgi:mannose-6-phosphate isomerase